MNSKTETDTYGQVLQGAASPIANCTLPGACCMPAKMPRSHAQWEEEYEIEGVWHGVTC